MKTKRWIALLLTAVLALSFAACGNSEDETKVWYIGEEKTDFKAIFTDEENTINPEKIYGDLEYNEKMLYGVYTLDEQEKGVKQIRKEGQYKTVEFNDGAYDFYPLPIAISSGKDYISSRNYNYYDLEAVKDEEIAILEFAFADNIGTVPCTYKVNGNKIIYTAIKQTSENGEPIEYENNKAVFEYDFSIKGPHLTLSNGDGSIDLVGYAFSKDCKKDGLQMSGYSLPDTAFVDELDYFSAGEMFNYAVKRDGSYYNSIALKLSEDGVATIFLDDSGYRGSGETMLKQYAYIVNCDGSVFFENRFSIILLDGENEYYYTDSITAREARILAEDGDVSSLTDEEIQAIAEKKSNLFDDLLKEFEDNGINATINRSTGEIAMDSTVLFGGDSAVVTADGKAFLDKFLKAYTDIIYNEKYDGFIEKTVIEGHIAPIASATYESGLPLSEERAKNVKDYCLSGETGVDTSKLAPTLETVGYSQSKPVIGADGNADLDASRRVSFRFVVNIEK